MAPPHLALKPPFLLFVFFHCFPFFGFIKKKKTLFPHWKRPFLFVYLWFPLFLFGLFWASPVFPFSFSSLLCYFFLSFLFLISVSGFCFFIFFFVLFVFVSSCSFVFAFSFVVLFCLNHNILFLLFVCIFFLLLLLFFVFLVWAFCYFLIFGNLSKTSLKNGNSKTTKMKNAEKKQTFWQERFAQLCSQTVFFGVFCIFAENTIEIGASAQKQKTKKKKNYKSKTGPSISQNWSKYVAQHNWTSF